MGLFGRRRPPPAPDAAAPPPASAAPSRHVIVCDDNESVTQLAGMMFTTDGWTVESVATGRDCLAALERRVPDVVLLDQQLGEGLTGLETAAQARRSGFDRPILLFSAHLDDAARKKAAKLDVIPVSKVDFPAVVRHVNAAHRAWTRRRSTPEARLARAAQAAEATPPTP